MNIHGFNKTTLLDYPKHLAATIFLGNCNFRCPFCHNSSLVLNPSNQPLISDELVLTTLKKRVGILEGVCITGGEPTLCSELPIFIRKIKALGLKVKLDTNGSNPTMLLRLYSEHLLDYVAMDIKNCKEKYTETIGLKNYCLQSIEESINLIKTSSIPYEFRTTVVAEFHSKEDFTSIGKWLQGSTNYYLQSYQDSSDILVKGLHAPTYEQLTLYKETAAPYIKHVELRGVE